MAGYALDVAVRERMAKKEEAYYREQARNNRFPTDHIPFKAPPENPNVLYGPAFKAPPASLGPPPAHLTAIREDPGEVGYDIYGDDLISNTSSLTPPEGQTEHHAQ